MFWGWDDHWAWESHIETWEPNKRLTLVENRPAFDVNGKALPGPAHRLAMEFTIETHGGRAHGTGSSTQALAMTRVGTTSLTRSAPAGNSRQLLLCALCYLW